MVINFCQFVGNHSWGNNTDHGDGGQNALRTMIEMPAWYPVKNTDGTWQMIIQQYFRMS